MKKLNNIRVGTAGWLIPDSQKEFFPEGASHLQRYSHIFNCVEINSSYYRDHKPETYAKWSESTPDDFTFSVKLSRYFTQNTKLLDTGIRLKEVLSGISALKNKWGALVVQLPPSLFFEAKSAEPFLDKLRSLYTGPLLWEPLNQSWCTDKAIQLLNQYQVDKVHADPEVCIIGPNIKMLTQHNYYRLHGTPKVYQSKYSKQYLNELAQNLKKTDAPSQWLIFDNMAHGYAFENAREVQQLLEL